MTHTHIEIERTYLLREMPTLPAHAVAVRIEQGYLVARRADESGAGPEHREGRVRRTTLPDGTVECRHTIKRGTGLVRQEIDRPITEAEFVEHWPGTAGARLTKTRHKVTEQDLCWEIDEFDALDVVLAEVELPEADVRPPLPAWLEPFIVREVTDEPAYRNYEIALKLATA